MSNQSDKPSLRVLPMPLGDFQTNAYVIFSPDQEDCLLIDPGFYPDQLLAAMDEQGLKPIKILLTHTHLDHIGGLDQARAHFPGVQVYAHEIEKDWPMNPELNLSAKYGFNLTQSPPDLFLDEGDTVELLGYEISVLHLPGHSPGSIGFYEPEHHFLIAGDTLFARGVGRTDLAQAGEEILFSSIREKIYTLPDETIVFPGHGPHTTVAQEKVSNPYCPAL